MKEKLLELFEGLTTENKKQLVDYARMLWEMDQSEEQLRSNLGIGKVERNEDQIDRIATAHYLKNKDKEIN